MKAFEYAAPRQEAEVLELLDSQWGRTEVLAGGTDLIGLMKKMIVTPDRVVNIQEVDSLRGISADSEQVTLGATTTLEELLDSTDLDEFPAVKQAIRGISSLQLQSQGTLGGELCQRPRCWYFRNGFGLLAKGGKLADGGENRYHAILGNEGPAYFVSPSTIAPLLIALGATVSLFGPGGAREVPVEKFFRVPRTSEEREHDLAPGEIVTEVRVPVSTARSANYEVREREGLDWPLVTAAVALRMSGNTVQSARVVLGHVAPVPWPSPEAEAALAGKAVSEAVAQAAGDAAVRKARALSGNGYKVQLARVAVKRAVLAAAGGGAR
jgi:xanthine dehydrogenase YagS FAD-binding subunit